MKVQMSFSDAWAQTALDLLLPKSRKAMMNKSTVMKYIPERYIVLLPNWVALVGVRTCRFYTYE